MLFFFFNDTATTEIYTLSLHDALPIWQSGMKVCCGGILGMGEEETDRVEMLVTLANLAEPPESVPINMLIPISGDRKSTRLNSSHLVISYAVFCLKKKRRLPEHSPTPQ